MLKRGLALLLVLTMVLSMAVTTYAEDTQDGQQTLELGMRVQEGDWEYKEYDKNDEFAATCYAVEIYANSKNFETYKMTGAELYVTFNNKVLVYRGSEIGNDESLTKSGKKKSSLVLTEPSVEAANQDGYFPLAFADNNTNEHVIWKNVVLATAYFSVKQGTESGTANFSFTAPADKENIISFNVTEQDNNSTKVVPHTIDGSATATASIKGITPILNTVKLNGETTATVTVDGTTGETVNATATSAQGTNLTEKVNWTVNGPEGAGENDVTIADNGVITVGAKAKAGDYSITATPKDGSSQSEAKSATLTVERATPVYTVTVTPESKEMTVPASGENKESFSATVTNQYDETMTEGVMWSIAPNDDNVSINSSTGEVTVKAAAKDTIQNTTGKNFTVTATYGENKADDTATLTVKRAASVVKSMNLAASAEESVIPADGNDMTVTLNISNVKDQYGTNAVLNGNVEWTASIADTQFEQNGNGGYTATLSTEKVLKLFNGNRNEEGVTVTFTAKCGDVQDSTQVKLTLADAVAKEIVLTSEPAGGTIVIPTGNTPNTKTYKAAVKDQYGFPMNDKAALSMNPESTAGVSFDADTGKVSVSKDATADKVYKVTATCGTATAEHTFTVKNKIMHADALNVMQSGFTYGESDKLAPSATLNGKAVEAAYSYTDSNSVAVDTPVNAGTYTVTARYETATDIYTGTKTFTIAQKALTAEMLTLSGEYTFNGNEQTVTYEVKDGNLLTQSDYTVTGSNATNAGTHTVTVTGQRNYSGEVKKSWSIAAAVVSIEGAVAINRDYAKDNKSVEIREVTFTNAANPNVLPGKNDYIATGMMADANADENKPVTVTVRMKNTNFTLEGSTFGTKVNIAKAAHDKIQTEMSAKYGNTATLNLKALNLPEGYTFGTIVTNDTDDKIFAANPSITGNTLSVELAADQAKVGKTGTITIPVSSTNYQDFNLIVTVTVLDKTAQTLSAEAIDTVYGESFTPNVSGAKTELTYKVKEGSKSLLKYENGKFTAIGVGEAMIVVTAAETEDYAPAMLEITVNIAKRTLTVKAADKSAYIGEKLPELTYEVSGLVGSDKLTKEPTLKLVHEAEADPMKTAGEYVITFDQAPAADAAKYDLVTADGKLTVSVRPVYVGPIGSPVEVGRSDNGTVTASPANAAKGTTVTITANPGKGQELKSLEVLDQHGSSLPLTDLGNGKFSFVMPAGKVTVKPVFGAANAYVNPYMDVQTNDWYFGAVQYVTENGLMNGTGNGFEPNLATSRAMIWTILARMSNVNTASGGEWYAVAQQWAKANGVSDGTMPNGTITREQLAAMLYRYAVSKGMVKAPVTANLSIFAGASSVSTYANEAMQWAVSTGLINGMDGKLNPQGSATRAQVATMLMRFAELLK